MANTAVLLLSFGTPSAKSELVPYMTSIRRGCVPNDKEIESLNYRYTAIEQWDNYNLQTMAIQQGEVLQEQLYTENLKVPVYVGYLHVPSEDNLYSIANQVKAIVNDGYSHIVAIVTAPFYSVAGTGDYERKLQTIVDTYEDVQLTFIQSWWTYSQFMDYWVQAIAPYVGHNKQEQNQDRRHTPFSEHSVFIFSAHSVPVGESESYRIDLERAAQILVQRLGIERYRLAFQSAPPRPGWLEPSIESIIAEVLQDGAQRIVFVPFGFVSAHVEVLYDNDIDCKALVEEGAALYERVPMPNRHSLFIEAMTSAVIERIKK